MQIMLQYFPAMLAVATVTGTNGNRAALVFGGTGRLGAPIVRLLIDAGYPVTVFARPTSDRSRLAGLDVGYLVGDLMDAGSVDQVVRGKNFGFVIDATSRGASRDSFFDTAMQNILHALTGSPVDQFILHGSVGAGANLQYFPEFGSGRMRELLLTKGKAEALLKRSGIGYTIIRSGMIDLDGTPATGRARLTDDQRTAGRITRLDLAALTLQCLNKKACMNKIFHAVDDSRD